MSMNNASEREKPTVPNLLRMEIGPKVNKPQVSGELGTDPIDAHLTDQGKQFHQERAKVDGEGIRGE